MNRKIDTESKIKTILEKIENKLRLIANDPDVMGYNYYNDSKFVGAKIVSNKKITLEQLAAKFDSFADVVMTKLDRLEDFAVKQLAFNEEQRAINAEQKKFNSEQKKFNNLLLSLPTIKKEVDEIKNNK